MHDLQIAWRPLGELSPHVRNPRTHSDVQVDQIAASIVEFGWTNPVLVDGANGIIAGHGPPELTSLSGSTPILPANRIVQIGIRSVDAVEKKLVVDSGMVVYDMRRVDELRMRTVMEQALAYVAERGDVHLHVSFDVDFLDPSIAPGVPSTVPGGPTYREAQLCMEMIHDSGLMASLDIMELNPAFDEGNRTAELCVELVESLRSLQHDFGGERAGAHPAPLFELEEVAAVAEDRSLGQSFEDVLFHCEGLLRKSFNARRAAL